MTANQAGGRKFRIGLVTGTLLLNGYLLAGCVYLHDEVRKNQAEEAHEQFQGLLKNRAISGHADNHAAMGRLADEIAREVHTLDEQIQLNALVRTTWNDIDSLTRELLDEQKDDLTNAMQQRQRAESRVQAVLAELPGVARSVRNHLEALNEASRARARFEATQGMLQKSLEALVDGTRSTSLASARSFLQTELSVDVYRESGDQLTVSSRKETISNLLGIPASSFGTAAPKTMEEALALLEAINAIELAEVGAGFQWKDPGLATTLAGLAYDIAQAQEQRLAVELEFARKEIKQHKALEKFLKAHIESLESHLDPGGLGIGALATAGPLDTAQTAEQSFRALVRDGTEPSRGLLRFGYMALGENYDLRVLMPKRAEFMRDGIARLEAERSLRLAGVRLAEREAVIGRGLSGLLAFHSGGIDRQDISRIIGLGQAIGIVSIANQQ